MHATRRKALSAATAVLLFSLGCSTDRSTLTEAPPSLDGASAQSRSGLEVRVSLAPEQRGNGPVMARVTVTNLTGAAVEISETELPSEDMETAQFVVMRNGQQVRYEGPHIKRGPVMAAEMVRIAAGATLTYDIELSRAYDLAQDGSYSVEFQSRVASSAQPSLRSARQDVRLYGRTLATNGISTTGLSSLTSLISYSKCTVTQQTQLVAALNQAATYAAQSKAYLAGNTLGDRYTWWFGGVTSANATIVRNNFTAIDNAFATKAITVDCGCKKTYYAYVYPSQPYKIYVCRAFWSAPLAGTDSRGGTLIHEMSHFNAVAGTDDWAYGQSAARSLALSNPLRAIDNADNHEYFAENTPQRQ
ncbi:M35 family metallo-endopeptidase [Gemmatimonas phototrophica]|uniref:M35 family metallo-endopeptidase n=1 Tax=Gemmatimonas phototrophica TaxID=1379270 RepID=UPI0006A6E0CE|nr:M35 family metallo-endopeptidase [Gemmatimonas phototrophica]